MTIPEVLQKLAHQDNKFPRAALEAAIAQQEAITPHLLEILASTTEYPDEVLDTFDYSFLYALYLLAQFREQRAYPLVIKLASLPPETADELLGDTITEGLPRILASVFDGDTAPLKALGENPEVELFVRAAAFTALSILLVHEVISREEVIHYFAGIFEGKIEKDNDALWGCFINVVTELYPEELYEPIKRAFEENLVDGLLLRLEEVDEDLALGKEARLLKTKNDPHHQLIENAIQEMEWWAWYKETPKPLPQPAKQPLGLQGTYVAPPKVGRNDPCPCGSGKKYKKCCGA